MTEVPDGIACADRCEVQATALGRLAGENAHAMLLMGVVFLLMGAVLMGRQVASYVVDDYYDSTSLGLGGVIVVAGLVMAGRWLQARARSRGNR